MNVIFLTFSVDSNDINIKKSKNINFIDEKTRNI